MNSFQGKVAIVTGGASGMGRELCNELGDRKAHVTVADINQEGAEETALTITAAGGLAQAACVDVSDGGQVQALVERTTSEHRRLDYMFNIAGVLCTADVRDLTLKQWCLFVDVNLWGVIHGTTAAYEVMVQQGSGHIVNMASLSGLIAFPTGVPYATTKHAIVGLSTSLRAEAVDLGVKVSVICPGFIHTNIWDRSLILGAEKEDVMPLIPFRLLDANRAARSILRGVEQNRAIIAFPFHSRILWWLYRLHPGLLSPLYTRSIRGFRKVRAEP
jgi:NAD(P)-dependent dehydrogenase (short-subunit alcohol dehydrogenase family)